jgi:hypothetical protein
MATDKDPVYKTLKNVALIVLVGGMIAGIAGAWLGLPGSFDIGIPAICLLVAAQLYRLTQNPRGWYTKRSVETFNTAYRPFKPLKPEREAADNGETKIDPDKLRAEIEALKGRP